MSRIDEKVRMHSEKLHTQRKQVNDGWRKMENVQLYTIENGSF